MVVMCGECKYRFEFVSIFLCTRAFEREERERGGWVNMEGREGDQVARVSMYGLE